MDDIGHSGIPLPFTAIAPHFVLTVNGAGDGSDDDASGPKTKC